MNEKELKRLNRKQLLELLLIQIERADDLERRLEEAQEKIKSRELAQMHAGSLAEAALQLSGVFEAAQASCEQYTENVRALVARQEKMCRQRNEESIRKSAEMVQEAEMRCAEMEAKTKAKCDAMLKKARAQAAQIKGTEPPAERTSQAPGASMTAPPSSGSRWTARSTAASSAACRTTAARK